jgi:hypothetical protein
MNLFIVIWFLLFGYFIVKSITQFIKNENSPIQTVSATIVDMRRKTRHHGSGNHHHHRHTYHVTFESDTGERIEFRVIWTTYRELSVGDRGVLTYQGTRYKGFER